MTISRHDLGGGAPIWLGDAEGRPPHWGGDPRKAAVVGSARLPSGARGRLVRIEPPLPRELGRPLNEAILVPRYEGHSLDDLADRSILVNVLGPAPGVDISKAVFREGELVIEFWADAALSRDALPKPIDEQAFWSETLERIRRFIAAHGDSRVPPDYADERGRLDIIVGNLRWHHAGKGGASPGPFPGVDYAADLDRLDGWEW
jgi:hypothetical protein